jgi:hypothetical protein
LILFDSINSIEDYEIKSLTGCASLQRGLALQEQGDIEEEEENALCS